MTNLIFKKSFGWKTMEIFRFKNGTVQFIDTVREYCMYK